MIQLRTKIVLAFSITILASTVLMVTIINYSTRRGYENFTKRNDLLFAERLLEPLTDFYATYNNWENIENYLVLPRPRMGEMMEGKGRNLYPPIILTDSKGNILVNTQRIDFGNIGRINRNILDHGLPIYNSNSVVGYLLTGSMIANSLSDEEIMYLNRVRAIIIYVSLFALVIAVIFSYIFSSKLTKPIRRLLKATNDIKSGDYTARVEVDGIDELSNLGHSFNIMAQSIENSDKWRKQIIADSAHELRTPVSLIQGNLEMILEGVYNPDREHLENIYSETKTLSRLIKELQELSSAESGSMVLQKEKLNIQELLNTTIKIFTPGTSVRFLTSIDENIPLITGDYQKLKQVVSNIISNGIKYTEDNGEIHISAYLKNSDAIIKISDNGCGISSDDTEKIFERFYRTDSSRNRKTGGSGLGLAISREIIKLHNGRIYAESEENKGTTITIVLPIA